MCVPYAWNSFLFLQLSLEAAGQLPLLAAAVTAVLREEALPPFLYPVLLTPCWSASFDEIL